MDEAIEKFHKQQGLIHRLIKKYAFLKSAFDSESFASDCFYLLRSEYGEDFSRSYFHRYRDFSSDSRHLDLRDFNLAREFLREHAVVCQLSLVTDSPPQSNFFTEFSRAFFSNQGHPLVKYQALLLMSNEAIGYYNPHQYPVTFTSTKQNRGPVTIDPRQPVLNVSGKLVRQDDDLDRQVADKILKRIVPGDPMYKALRDHDTKADKRANIVSTPANQLPVPQAQETGQKDYEIEDVDGTQYYSFGNKRFVSLAALRAYQETLK